MHAVSNEHVHGKPTVLQMLHTADCSRMSEGSELENAMLQSLMKV